MEKTDVIKLNIKNEGILIKHAVNAKTRLLDLYHNINLYQKKKKYPVKIRPWQNILFFDGQSM